jgi:hypothetical protein
MPYESRGKGDILTALYHSAAWRTCRALCLNRDGHQCVRCHKTANTVHHKPPGARALIARGDDPCDPMWCETLCHHCHGEADGAKAHPEKTPKVNRFLRTVLSKSPAR